MTVLPPTRAGRYLRYVGSIFAGLMFGGGFGMIAFHYFVPNAPALINVAMFVVLVAIFAVAFNWAWYERRTELDRAIPTPSKELRRQRKTFYDSLERRDRH